MLKNALNFFLARINASRDERGGRILLGDNTGAGDVVLRTIRFQRVLEYGFKLDSVVYSHGSLNYGDTLGDFVVMRTSYCVLTET